MQDQKNDNEKIRLQWILTPTIKVMILKSALEKQLFQAKSIDQKFNAFNTVFNTTGNKIKTGI